MKQQAKLIEIKEKTFSNGDWIVFHYLSHFSLRLIFVHYFHYGIKLFTPELILWLNFRKISKKMTSLSSFPHLRLKCFKIGFQMQEIYWVSKYK